MFRVNSLFSKTREVTEYTTIKQFSVLVFRYY